MTFMATARAMSSPLTHLWPELKIININLLPPTTKNLSASFFPLFEGLLHRDTEND